MTKFDRFGFPITWGIEFTRSMLSFEKVKKNWTKNDHHYLTGTRLLIDQKVDTALSELQRIEEPTSFAELFNIGKAYLLNDEHNRGYKYLNKAFLKDSLRYKRIEEPFKNDHITLIIPFPVNTGGMKTQIELGYHLQEMGYNVSLIQIRGNEVENRNIKKDFISTKVINGQADLTKSIAQSELVIVGSWVDYYATLCATSSPIIGYSGGEPSLNEEDGFAHRYLTYIQDIHQLPLNLMTCSRFIQQLFSKRFTRDSTYIPTIIDSNIFKPMKGERCDEFRVLLVGRDSIFDKGLGYAIPALQSLIEEGLKIKIVWISPSKPDIYTDINCELYVSPEKKKIGEIYSSCDILIFPSIIEGLGFPPLEAMASGTAVVVTRNGGSSEYAEDEINCLLVEIKSKEAIKQAVKRLYYDSNLHSKLIVNGYTTAKFYSKDNFIFKLKNILAHINSQTVCTELPQ
jgi:glycosyltransferase involved in cell wall biosynthesis